MEPIHYEMLASKYAKILGMSRPALVRVMNEYFGLLYPRLQFGDAKRMGQEVNLEREKLDEQIEGYDEPSKNLLKILHGEMFLGQADIVVPLAKFHRHGCKVFNISRGLVQRLHATDVSGIYEYLRYPYPCFYLNFQKCPVFIEYNKNGYEESDRVLGVYVDATGTAPLTIFLAVTDSGLWIRSCLDAEVVSPEKTVNMEDFRNGELPTRNPSVDLAVKVLLYLACESAETQECENEYGIVTERLKRAKEQKKKDRLTKHLQTLSMHEFVDVGRSIKVRKGKHAEARSKEDCDAGHYYNYRFWVRGHFKNQPYGPKRSLRKLKWIEPYLKGPDQADIVHRQYDVE